jgi:hypothetical protein
MGKNNKEDNDKKCVVIWTFFVHPRIKALISTNEKYL